MAEYKDSALENMAKGPRTTVTPRRDLPAPSGVSSPRANGAGGGGFWDNKSPSSDSTGGGGGGLTSGGTGGGGSCSGCGKPLAEQNSLRAMNGVWHPQCFTCARCHQEFNNLKFTIHQERPYHAACKKAALGRVCAKCSKALEGRCVRDGDKMFHSACFVCSKCNKALSGGYSKKGLAVFCEPCARTI
eukprot:TRINITY_DN27_c1_g1_i3.p1 TRINITY_DN27_c1_g1~~TRINITY_DN27_c1_g1_i3.p1  ORF type:complete len:188 (+),score=15.93 TRINITY_DN27_c1_g1_i3:176-739(+)